MTVSHARPLALALVLLSILTSGCTKIQTSTSLSSTSNPWTVHGILRVGSYEDLDSLNPIVSTQAFVTDVDQMVFSGLIDYDEHGNPVPDVALEVPTTANGGISRDGKTITYHLRRGVKFTDGVPLTSADVKYTWEQIVNPSNNVGYRYPYDQVVSVDTPDDYTVIVHLRAPLASFVAAFMRNGVIGSIVPRHLLSGYADLNKLPFNTHPVGSGPFYVERWEPGTLLTLRANPTYWRGPPKLKEVQYRIITSQNTLMTDVMSHNIDLYYDAPEVQYATLKAQAGYRITAVPNMTYEHVEFNCARPPLDDVRVRQALAYAIDWNKIAQNVYLGLDAPGMADTPPTSWAYDPSVKPYPHDLARARKLLKDAGWTPDAAGVLTKNGEPFRIDISTVAGITSRAKAEELMQQDLAALGIQLEVRNYQANLLFATYGYGGILARGNFNLSLYAWEYTFPDPDNTNTRGPDELPPKGENYSRCRDADIGIWERAGQAHYERAQRRPYYVLMQRRFHETVPFHTIVWRANIDVVNTDLRNFKPAPSVSDFWNSWEWQI
jgi:peptide/nickel transport system substrate-binding protein